MEASIQEVARLTGTTSRTLRHYDAIGLLAPSRVGDNGYRWYDDDALVRLQRILLLRDLGLGLGEIGRGGDRGGAATGGGARPSRTASPGRPRRCAGRCPHDEEGAHPCSRRCSTGSTTASTARR